MKDQITVQQNAIIQSSLELGKATIHEACKIYHSNGEKCQREKNHDGVHLSDETGKLVFWV